MSGDERLEKLSRVYGIFGWFQVGTLTAGILAASLAGLLSNDVCGGLYVIILFGQVIAFILFGIITANMTDSTMRKRHPRVKPRKSLDIGPGGFRYSEDLNGPMLEEVRKTRDQLAEEIYRKTGRAWLLCILNVFLPTLAMYLMRALTG